MASPLKNQLRSWMNHLSPQARLEFRPFNLDSLFTLQLIPINWDFLEAAACHWDPLNHVFHFNLAEICPTVEEFSAILGFNPRAPLMVPSVQTDYTIDLCMLFGESPSRIQSHIQGNRYCLQSLITHFSSANPMSLKKWSHNALCFCLLAHYLIITGDQADSSTGDCALASVVTLLSSGQNPAGIILAETFNGLDQMFGIPDKHFLGSPLLLQIWLYERLSLYPHVPRDDIVAYSAKRIRSRQLQRPCSNLGEWIDWMGFIHASDIRWSCPWWKIQVATLHTFNPGQVIIAGLRICTFYSPLRILRQFGINQTIPTVVTTFGTGKLTPRIANKISSTWPDRSLHLDMDASVQVIPDADFMHWIALDSKKNEKTVADKLNKAEDRKRKRAD